MTITATTGQRDNYTMLRTLNTLAQYRLYRPMMKPKELYRDTIINNKPYRKQSIKNLVVEHFNHMVNCCQELYFVFIY